MYLEDFIAVFEHSIRELDLEGGLVEQQVVPGVWDVHCQANFWLPERKTDRFHASAQVEWDWPSYLTARMHHGDQTVLQELLGSQQGMKTQPTWLEVSTEISLWFPAEHGFDFDTWRDQVWDFVEELLPIVSRPKGSTYYATELAGRFPLRFSFLADDEERWEGLWPDRIELGGFQIFQLPGQTFENELDEETGDVVTEMVKLVNRIRTLMLVVEEAANQPGVRPSANGNGRFQ